MSFQSTCSFIQTVAFVFKNNSISFLKAFIKYGYTFIYGGFPCSVIGAVKDPSQPEEEKQMVKEIVDEMMQTVRDTP